MSLSKYPQHTLLAILGLNFLSTGLHYTDNALFLDWYPGPDWFTPIGILVIWMVMTPVGLLGYGLYRRRLFWLAYLFLGVYSITSISSLGHYFFPVVTPMSIKIHGLIWFDAIAGLMLVSFLFWSFAVAKEWRNVDVADS